MIYIWYVTASLILETTVTYRPFPSAAVLVPGRVALFWACFQIDGSDATDHKQILRCIVRVIFKYSYFYNMILIIHSFEICKIMLYKNTKLQITQLRNKKIYNFWLWKYEYLMIKIFCSRYFYLRNIIDYNFFYIKITTIL